LREIGGDEQALIRMNECCASAWLSPAAHNFDLETSLIGWP
jgi:hypothetical protein